MTTVQLQNGITGDARVVHRLSEDLAKLTSGAPRSAIEFMRVARRRKHQIFGTPNVACLRAMGLIDPSGDNGYTAHDVWRDFVRGAVIGDGLRARILCPVHGIHPLCSLRDGRTQAYLPLVDALHGEFQRVQQQDPVALVELLRLCNDDSRKQTFGNSLRTLLALGYVELQQPRATVVADGDGDLDGMLGSVLDMLSSALTPPTVVVHDVVKTLLPLCVEGQRGLSVHLRLPYDQQRTRRHATEGSGLRNGDWVATV